MIISLQKYPDLARIAKAWPKLPEAIRAAITALINAAKAIGLKNFQIKVGAQANIVVLDEDDVWEALRNHSEPLYVISHGKLVDMGKIGRH